MTGSITDGEDVVQDALFRAYRSLDTFDDSRPLAPWLFARCASPAKNADGEEPNACRSKRRRRSRGVPHWLSIGYHKRRIEMTVATTLDIFGMLPEEYRAVMDKLGVEERPEAGIYLHATITMDFGYRVVEIWERKEQFEDFLEKRLAPVTKTLGINRKIEITITPLHNLFAPRLDELAGLVGALPGGPGARQLSEAL